MAMFFDESSDFMTLDTLVKLHQDDKGSDEDEWNSGQQDGDDADVGQEEDGDLQNDQETYRYTLGGTSVHGILDFGSETLKLLGIEGQVTAHSVHRILKAVIANMECNHPDTDVIQWEVLKSKGIGVIEWATKAGFQIFATTPMTIVLSYHMMGWATGGMVLRTGGGEDSGG